MIVSKLQHNTLDKVCSFLRVVREKFSIFALFLAKLDAFFALYWNILWPKSARITKSTKIGAFLPQYTQGFKMTFLAYQNIKNLAREDMDGPILSFDLTCYINMCILAYLYTFILAYLHICIFSYLHTCIYVHTCILAY